MSHGIEHRFEAYGRPLTQALAHAAPELEGQPQASELLATSPVFLSLTGTQGLECHPR